MRNAKSPEPLEKYLKEVTNHLVGLPENEAMEIIAELRSHVLDRVSDDLNHVGIERALELLGNPREVARLNMTVHVATRAVDKNSPLVIIHTIARLARLSFKGLIILMTSLVGYSFAASWLLAALAKPFVPDRVGLWSLADPTGDLSLSLGRKEATVAGQDILGFWIIPIGLAVGLCAAYITYRFDRWSIRQMAKQRAHSGSPNI